MFCHNCGALIEENCRFCVACGAKVELDSVPAVPTVNEVQSTEMPAAEAEPQSQSVVTPNSFDYSSFTPASEIQPEKKPKRSKKWLSRLIATVLVVAVLAGSFFAFKDYIIFGFLRMMPAKTQFQYVYSRAAANLSEDVAEPLGTARDMMTEDETIKGNVSLEIGDGVPALLSDFGVDLGKLDTVSVNYNITKNDGLSKLALDIGDGNVKIVGAEICIDSERGIMTVSIPELNGDVLEIDLEHYTNIEKEDLQKITEVYETVLPSPQLVEKLIPRYTKIAFEQITNISRSGDTLEAKGITQKTTRFDAVIDEDTVKNMLIAMVEEMRNDKDIKEYIIQLAEMVVEMADDDDFDDDPQEMYEDFRYELDKVIDNIDDTELDFDGYEIVFTTHANSKGDIIGLGFSVDKGDDKGLSIEYAKVRSGNDVGILGECTFEGETVAQIEGAGTMKGDKYTGDVTFTVKEEELISFEFTDFDIEAYKDGYPKGTVEIELDGIVSKLLFGVRDNQQLANNASASIILDYDCSKKETNVVMSIKILGFDIGSISVTQKVSKAEKITIPAETEDDPEEWANDIDLNQIKENLDEVGILEIFEIFEDLLPNMGSSSEQVVIQPR